LSRREIA
jgi:hypothetical protein